MARTRTPRQVDPWLRAVKHLRSVDANYWTPLIREVGPCQLRPRPDRFGTLVRAVIGQQISTKAAASIEGRLKALGGDPHEARALLKLGEDALRSVGISAGKTRTILDLAQAVAQRDIPIDALDELDDDGIVARLTTIKGIGVWTAEMFLIFCLNRPDVLPVHDLGVRVAIQHVHGLDEIPKPKHCLELGEPWRPYRSVASWYLWRQIDLLRKPKT